MKTNREIPLQMMFSKEGSSLNGDFSDDELIDGKEEKKIVTGPIRLCEQLVLMYKHTKVSTSLSASLSSLFTERMYNFRLSVALNMSSSAGGIVNSVIDNATIGSVTEFSALSAIFNEFFIQEMHAVWQPVSLYNGPIGYAPATTVASLPLGCCGLQHGQTAYSSVSSMLENSSFSWNNTGKGFTKVWRNDERHTDDTLPAIAAAATQSWATISNVANYRGTLQFLTQSAPPGLPVSQVLGTFAVTWNVWWRVRS